MSQSCWSHPTIWLYAYKDIYIYTYVYVSQANTFDAFYFYVFVSLSLSLSLASQDILWVCLSLYIELDVFLKKHLLFASLYLLLQYCFLRISELVSFKGVFFEKHIDNKYSTENEPNMSVQTTYYALKESVYS